MRKIISLILITSSLALLPATSINIGLDAFSIDSLINSNLALRGEVAMSYDDIKISNNIGFYKSFDKDCLVNAINTSLNFAYFPFEKAGFYLGATLIDYTYIFGLDTPEEPSIFLTSIRTGYIFTLFNHLSFDFRASLFDSAIKDLGIAIKQLSRYRFSLTISYRWNLEKKEDASTSEAIAYEKEN